jgi:hypothetical protein
MIENSANMLNATLLAMLAQLKTIAAQEPKDAQLAAQMQELIAEGQQIITLITPPPVVLAGVTVTVTEKEK